mgnify:CR=1 FL=1
MKEFSVGSRVYSSLYDEEGVVEEKLYSQHRGALVYMVTFDNGDTAPHIADDLVEVVASNKAYRWDVFQADSNMVTAVMYEVVDGVEREVDRQHGHIIHGGEIGVAQAASYAMKKIYIGMNDGKYIGTEDR